MQRFTLLFTDLDESNRTSDKVEALSSYFREADPADAAWALYFLTGRKIERAVNTTLLRRWTAEEAGLPLWLLEECHDAVGDLAETLALLLGERKDPGPPPPLHQLVEESLLPLRSLPEDARRQLLVHVWRRLDARERLVWNKVITGSFRIGVARTLVIRALAEVADIPPAVMAHRLMGSHHEGESWRPTAGHYRELMRPESAIRTDHAARPYPFFLAHPIEAGTEGTLGEIAEWQAEWKWDGIRAQLIRRGDQVLIWTRGEELVTDRYPEVESIGRALPPGTVLDGEILAWREGQPLPFGELQKRIGRRSVGSKLLQAVPVAYMAYDLLESEGLDRRAEPLHERRRRLEAIAARPELEGRLLLSPLVISPTWEDLALQRAQARARGVEGLMLKRRTSSYGVGRVRGEWWKWKIEPHTLDAVLIYAQQGSGRRASLLTDYTFGVWRGNELVPIAKAYSGLTDAEIREVDRFVRSHTLEKHGPVRVVEPQLVFELAFDGIQRSSRHKAGVALRFPRMARWRRDKTVQEADRLETVLGLLAPDERTA